MSSAVTELDTRIHVAWNCVPPIRQGELVAAVIRLVTLVEVEDDGAAATHQISVRARHEAVLADGRHLLLFGDRGWTSRFEGPGNARSETSIEEIKRTARVVVGPDEPLDGHSRAEMEARHWEHLAGVLRAQGVAVEPEELKQLPHDVELCKRLRTGEGWAR